MEDTPLLPSSDIAVETKLPLESLHKQIKSVCKELVPGWRDFGEEDMTVCTISGGITNFLVKVSVEDAHVTLRVFGDNTELVIDRKRELQALLHLSQAGFGAKLIGVFKNGMVQSFIDAETLKPEDMSRVDLVPLIAKELRRLHDADVPFPKQPQLWSDVAKMFGEASAVTFEDGEKRRKLETIRFDLLEDELRALKVVTDSLHSPIVFAHNDLLSGNIMMNFQSGTLFLIDFEYSGYNYRGFDIGNHFNEYAGFDCDFSLYPDKEAQYRFFRHYLYPDSPEKASDEELDKLYVESNCYALASHLCWALWGIVQARFSSIEFDYLEYFFLRYNEYKRRKVEFTSLAFSFLSKTMEQPVSTI